MSSRSKELIKIGLSRPISDSGLKWIEKHDPELAEMIKKNRRK